MRECPLRGLTPRAEIEKRSHKVSDSHRNDVSPLTHGLRYRAACDTRYIGSDRALKSRVFTLPVKELEAIFER